MSDDDEGTFWDDILDGERPAIEIVYLALDEVELDEIEEWGEMTGMWSIRLVDSVPDAIQAHKEEPANLMILLGASVSDAQRIANECPELPLSIAKNGGWDGFPEGWPDQVVVAQWAAPRPGEFQDGVESALAKVRTSILYEEPSPSIEIYSAISEEFLARLGKFPEDRFYLNPQVFEETVAELLSRMGYDVKLTPRTGDEGRDVIAAIGTPAAKLLLLVECKKYAPHRKVGIEPVTRLWSRLFDDHANMAMVVTTSGFAPVAERFAVSRGYQVSLKDGNDFIGWVRSAGLQSR